LRVLVFDPTYQRPPKRVAPVRLPSVTVTNAILAASPAVRTNALVGTNTAAASSSAVVSKPKFTKQQIAGRLRQLKLLFEEGMLTDEFYSEKVAECEAAE
jgi:hypothetical protein